MKRRTSTAPIRVYSYGCRLPTANADLVEQQLVCAHHYYNTLIEIERRRRVATREAQSASSSAISSSESSLASYETEIAKTLEAINAKKGKARTSKIDLSSERQILSTLRALKKKTIENLKVAKQEARTPALLEIFASIQEKANDEVREARSKNGLYWGTYLLVEQSVQLACKSKTDPEFHRFRSVPNRQGLPSIANGRVGVELIQGVEVSKLVGGQNTQLQIDSPSPNRMSKVKIRIGSGDSRRSPLFAEFPFRMHRPLPADGLVKWAWISKSTKGRWVNWSLQIVVEAESLRRVVRPPSDGGVVAFDIGWRQKESENPGKLRIAYWHDDRGNHGELIIPHEESRLIKTDCLRSRPNSIRNRLDHATSLRSIQDKNFDAVRTDLIAWMVVHDVPTWLSSATEWLHAWKSQRKLGAVVEQWSTSRFDGDSEIFDKLTSWWKQHRHLYDWESCERDRSLNARNNLYRNWAAQFTRKYAVVVLEDHFLAKVAKLQQPESTKSDMPKPTRRNRTIAACSEFALALKNAAPGNGCSVDYEPYDDTTATCSYCGLVERFDHRPLEHPCERCGSTTGPVDQDRTAARNLLAAWAQKQSRSQSNPQPPEDIGGSETAVAMPAQGAMP